MDTLITPNVVMLTALVVWTLGALTLYLVYCRHGEPARRTAGCPRPLPGRTAFELSPGRRSGVIDGLRG